jgi:hypothetical protein
MNDNGPISYAEFGEHFIRRVVTAERLRSEVQALLVGSIEGEVHKLPADLLSAGYRLTPGGISVAPTALAPAPLRFRLDLDGKLDLRVRLLGLPLRFSVRVRISLDLAVRTQAPLTIRLLPALAGADAVRIDVNPHSIPGELLDQLNIIEPAVTEEIVNEVRRRLVSPQLIAATTIDVLALAQRAQLAAASPDLPPAGNETVAAA